MRELTGTFTAKCGWPQNARHLIARANELLKIRQEQLFVTLEWRLERGPYVDGDQICLDYHHEPTQRY